MNNPHPHATTISTIPCLDKYSSLEEYLHTPEPLAGLPLWAISLSLDRCEGIMALINCLLEADGHSKSISNHGQYIHCLEVFQTTMANIHKSITRSVGFSKDWQPSMVKGEGQGFVVNLVFNGLKSKRLTKPTCGEGQRLSCSCRIEKLRANYIRNFRNVALCRGWGIVSPLTRCR